MRFLVSIVMTPLLILSACAPGGNGTPGNTPAGHSVSEENLIGKAETPGTISKEDTPALISNNGTPFTIGADVRVPEEVKKQRPNPQEPLTPTEKKVLVFSDSLEDFKFFRYSDSEKKKLDRFGKSAFEFKVQIKTPSNHHIAVNFSGDLKPSGDSFEFANVKTDKLNYTLTGLITDGKDTTIGNFEIGFKDHRAKIFYRAYKGKPTLRLKNSQDWSKIQELKARLDLFKEGTQNKSIYAWAMNMVVVGVTVGVSRFHYDILRIIDPGKKEDADKSPLLFSFDGDSTRQGVVPSTPITRVQSAKGDIEKMQLEGDAEIEDSRVFSMVVKDKQSGQSIEAMMDIERDSDAPEMALPNAERPKPRPIILPPKIEEFDPPASMKDEWQLPEVNSDVDNGAPLTPIHPPAPKAPPKNSTPISKPRPATPSQRPETPAAPATPAEPHAQRPAQTVELRGVGPKAYFYTDYGNPNLPRTKHAIDDFEKNYGVRQVQEQLAIYSRPSGKLNRWFYYEHPFTPLIESIARTYDVPPAFVFLIVRESEYFSGPIGSRKRGRSYPAYSFLNPNTTSAVGPFQIIADTAIGNGIAAERNLPPNKGGRPVGPSDERNFFAPSACGAANYLGNNMKRFGGDYALGILAYYQGEGTVDGLMAQIRRYGGDYSYDYATIARNHMIGKDPIQYVAEVLAAYFVAGDYRKYGFTSDSDMVSLPANAIPASGVRSQKCQSAIDNRNRSS